MSRLAFALAATTLAAALPVTAADTALVVGNENYRHAASIRGADAAPDVAEALKAAGLSVIEDSDQPSQGLRGLLQSYYDDAAGPGRSVIVLLGHFAHAGGEAWFLGTDADTPDLAGLDAVALPLATVFTMAAERPGGALVILGSEERRLDLGRGVLPGIGTPDVPQGVTLVTGDAAVAAAFAETIGAGRGLGLAELLAGARDLQVSGFLGTDVFLAADAPVPPGPANDIVTEDAVWEAARAAGNQAAYEAYLRRYPDGRHQAEARRAIAELNDPVARARAGEDALNLSRDQRRQIQRNLSVLDIDPRGIDGLFGPGSRNAIAAWQRMNGSEATGYMTRDQMVTLGAQAERRAAELEAEAAARQADLDRQDRLYWEQTGRAGDEPGLRAYLKRYPDGLFAELAQERLNTFEDKRRQEAQAADRAYWDAATRTNTVAGYRDYIASYPRGAFVEEAQSRIDVLSESQSQQTETNAAAAAEDALALNPPMKRLLEQRLDALGLKPGKIDGVFDADTRRAIRRYQKTRGMKVTGYLNQQTVARLLVDSL